MSITKRYRGEEDPGTFAVCEPAGQNLMLLLGTSIKRALFA